MRSLHGGNVYAERGLDGVPGVFCGAPALPSVLADICIEHLAKNLVHAKLCDMQKIRLKGSIRPAAAPRENCGEAVQLRLDVVPDACLRCGFIGSCLPPMQPRFTGELDLLLRDAVRRSPCRRPTETVAVGMSSSRGSRFSALRCSASGCDGMTQCAGSPAGPAMMPALRRS